MPDIKDMQAAEFADIFGGPNHPSVKTANFGGGIDNSVDIFDTPTVVDPPKKDDVDPAKLDDIKEGDDVDIFDDSNPKVDKDKPLEIKGLSDYYQDRVKNGLFLAVDSEDESGKKISFVPQTPEEFDEVIELQVNYKLEQAKKEMQEKWYEAKSPAWKAISQYAELVDDPSQLIPFLEGVKTIQTVSNLNEEDADQAEQIVRSRMEQRGDPESIIKSQIDALKSTDSLITTAKQVKPLMVQQEQQMLARQVQDAKMREQEYLKVIDNIRENAHKAIEQPIFGKQKLKQEEKALIYDMIAMPSEETQGYGIYTAIDKLFDTGDFETLKQVALLLGKKESFFGYLGTDFSNKTAASLQKKLSLAGDSHKGGGNDMNIQDRPVVQRNQFSKTPRFGK